MNTQIQYPQNLLRLDYSFNEVIEIKAFLSLEDKKTLVNLYVKSSG